MVAKMTSPLGSPTLAATTAFRNRLPTQFRRILPIYIVVVVLVLFFFNLTLFRSSIQQSSFVDTKPEPHKQMQVPKLIRPEFPRKIWQTWKVNPLAFEQRDLNTARTWTKKNPDYRYEVLTDTNDMYYVEYHFGPDGFNRPDIVDFYRNVKAAIVKADLLRYMVMYAEGGLYADIDVEDMKPLSKFIPERYDVKDIDMVIGVEIDEPDWKDHPILGPKSRSFCQWTFMCKPQLPVMMRLIEQIMTWLNGVAKEQDVPLAKVKLDFDQIISGTGPSAFTNAIIADMNERRTDPNEKNIDWNVFHDMSESKLVNGVLVLTVEAFAAGQGHSDSGNHDARAALVKHHYHASNWPSKHPRFKHPAYGEVESCNWRDECVRKWDKDVAAFKKLPEEEQKRIIAEKERERKEKEDKEKKEKEERERRKKEEDEAKRRKDEEERRKKEEENARKKKEEADKAAMEKETLKPKPMGEEGLNLGLVVKPPGDTKP